jgi:ATP-dependent RNA helicase DHX57
MDVPLVGKSTLEFRFPLNSLYPHEVPICFFKNKTTPPKLRRKIMEKMVEECKNMIGGAMIYSLTLWLTSNIAAIDANEPVISPLLLKDKQGKDKSKQDITQIQEKEAEESIKSADPTKLVRRILKLTQKDKEVLSKQHFQEFQEKQNQEGYIKLKKVRERLPVFVTREKFLETLSKNQVVVLTGETGSGKTTQVRSVYFYTL